MKAAKGESRRWVVDSSFVCSLFLPDESSGETEAFFSGILSDEIWAPALLKYEVTNVLKSALRRKRIMESEAAEVLSLFLGLPIRFDPLENTARPHEILSLSKTLELSGYDASYLELAIVRDATLLTLDENLKRAAKKKRIKVS